jgi:hypothetical protein
VRWAVAASALIFGYVVGTFYFLYLQRSLNLNKAVKKLVNAFDKDIASLL